MDMNLYVLLPRALIARPRIIPMSSEANTVGWAAELISSDPVCGVICDASA